MTRDEFLKVKEELITCGWVVDGTSPKQHASEKTDYGLRMIRGADTFWLNQETAHDPPTHYPKIKKVDSYATIKQFKEMFPLINHGKLTLHQMRGMVDGDLIPVKITGTKKFQVWTKEDIDSGKLDKLNAEIRRINSLNRQMRRSENDRLIREIRSCFQSAGYGTKPGETDKMLNDFLGGK